jgi:hypothetical protein
MNKILILLISLFSITSFARGGGGHSLGLGFGIVTASQDDLESHSTTVNQIGGGRSAAKPGSGTEIGLMYEYRFSGSMFAMQFRPSYFMQSGSGGTDKSSLTGFSIFPLMRFYPLENNFIRFFMQVGLGYGSLSGKITQPGGTIDFSGGAFGALGGLGAMFCFTDSHCMFLEGNFRYLPIERNLAKSSYDNTPGTTGFSQAIGGQELEYQGNDLKTTMSGIVGSIGYTMNF